MRKHILPRLKTLLGAACATLYTRQARAATSKFSLEPKRAPEAPDLMRDPDAWMFETECGFEAKRAQLSREMNQLADGLAELRETLALIHGETPFPIEATTEAPCAIVHHDDALFDGETNVPVISAQEEVTGGEGVFLFGDEPTFQDEQVAHQQAA